MSRNPVKCLSNLPSLINSPISRPTSGARKGCRKELKKFLQAAHAGKMADQQTTHEEIFYLYDDSEFQKR